MTIKELGYFLVGAPDVEEWRQFATRILGAMAIDGPDGALYVANNGGIAPLSLEELKFADPPISGRIQCVALDGSWRDFAVDLPGEAPWRPNDLVFSPAGDIVFTDPQNWEVLQEWDAADRAWEGDD